MAKKLLAMLLASAMVMSVGTVAFAEEAETEAAPTAVLTVGPDDAVGKFELWSFVDLHNTFYANMVEEWNALNPDKTVQITFSTYPYSDMHNKLMMSLQAGSGAPDFCDVEIGQFPNYIGDDCPLVDLGPAMEPYADTMVQARMDVYKNEAGVQVGVPTHVGATVMYWNAEIFEQYGLDYKSVKTWDDYTALGEQLRDASNGEVFLTSVDTGGVDWMWVAMAQHGEDWTGGPGGTVNVQLESVEKMLTMQQGWLNDGIAMVQHGDDWTGGHGGTPNVQLESVEKMLTMQQQWLADGIAMISTDGHVDLEAGFANISSGKIASFPKAMWYLSRFTGYMPEMEGKYDITKIPVFEEGQPSSVAIGGTGTVVTNQCDNPELAAEWLAWAKCSDAGCAHIWNDLGFDVCNTAVWTDEAFAFDESNVYNTFFRVKPYEVLKEIADEINPIYTTKNSPIINDYFCTTTLNYVLEEGWDVAEALQDAQDYIDFECE